jgi:pilus assembly protein CpaE
MSRSAQIPHLRVLLTGAAADRLAPDLEHAPVAILRREARGGGAITTPAVDVALHVLPSSSVDATEEVRRIQEAAGVPLILAAYGEPNGIVEHALELGAADVLVLPQSTETLLFALRKAAIARGRDGEHAGKIITVFSPKGGSGKTVLATNLAVAASRSGFSTLLVDLDLQFGDAALTLSVSPRATISDLFSSTGAIDREKLAAFVTRDERSGLDVLPAPKRPEDAEVIRPSELASMFGAAKAAYDAVVVDTGPLFDAAMLGALDQSDRLLLVSNPEVTSLKNVRIGLDTIERLGFPMERVSIVANRLGAAGGIDRVEMVEALRAEIAFAVPDDIAVPEAVNRVTPAVLGNDNSRFARAVLELSAALFGEADDAAPTVQRRRFLVRGRQ